MRPRVYAAAIAAAAALSFPAAAQAAPLDTAAQHVRSRAAHLHGSRHYRLMWAIGNYVHHTVDPVRYERLQVKPQTVDEFLRDRAGICGSQVATVLALSQRLGVKARPVQFYYPTPLGRGSHIAVEFRVGGRWRFFDVTWSTVYPRRKGGRALMSWAQLSRLTPAQRRAHRDTYEPDAWRVEYTRRYGSVFSYLAGNPDTIIDGRGSYRLPRAAGAWVAIPNVPDYIGSAVNVVDGKTWNLTARLTGVQSRRVVLHVRLSACASGTVVARSRVVSSQPVDVSTRDLAFDVAGRSVSFSVTGGCYLMLAGAS